VFKRNGKMVPHFRASAGLATQIYGWLNTYDLAYCKFFIGEGIDIDAGY
jgi:hypothetical protein